jgi:ribonucleoside-diphosphate reductase alpha chain
MDTFQNFIAISRYSRWMDSESRRETWDETVDRWWNYFTTKVPALTSRPDIRDAILNLEVLPSMRGLMTAGPALDRDHTALYNCSYLEIDSPKAFSNLMYILMCGTGVGYTVERRCTDKMPTIPTIHKMFDNVMFVEDSREGWCDSLHQLIDNLYKGVHLKWDTSKVRKAGEKLKTFGGRASGPAPLEEVFRFVVQTFYKAQGRRLTPLECHDICCKIAQSVIVGGVRRSAMISLSDLADREMATCKSGAWWESSGHRALANNSAVYNGRPSMGQFLEEWTDLYNSHSGERGICNRDAMRSIAAKAGRDVNVHYGTNPCSEIILRPNQFCNLSTVVVRASDTPETLAKKIEMATIIGTIQSMFTHFPYLSREDSSWTKNCEEERLLGVSMTGIFDNKLMSGILGYGKLKHVLENLREVAIKTNLDWAKQLGINPSKSITCIKPEGTTSCLANSASGLHPRYAQHYYRRVRIDKKDPIYQLMRDAQVMVEDCVMNPDSTAVFTFAQSAPSGSLTQDELQAIDHLNLWLAYQEYYCQHKPSITVNYSDSEFMPVGQWVWENFDKISGISFLPKSDHVYAQAPFEAITKETYDSYVMVPVDFNNLSFYEKIDTTTSSHTMACTAGACEIIDLKG